MKQKNSTKKPFYKKWWFWAIVVIMLLPIADGDDADSTTPSDTTVVETTIAPQIISPETLDDAFEHMLAEIDTIEEASSARVDEIARIAKADAVGITDDLGNEACVFIIEHFPDFYTDNEMMEKIIYCGYLLEYGYEGGDVAKLGQDTYQAVKYVYRGAETVDSEATQENLRKIKELLDEKLK